MNIPKLQMTSQLGRIQIEQLPSSLSIKQPKATLTIEQAPAEMTIRTKAGKLTIDQSQAWEERNLMSTVRFSERHAQESLKAVQEGIARRAEQGAQLLKIEHGQNVIAEQAIENGHPKMKSLGIGYVPSPFSVKYHYEPSQVDIQVELRKPNIQVQVNKPEIRYERARVQISMAQYPHLEISLVDEYV